MNIPQDHIPTTLDEAVELLKKTLTAQDIILIRDSDPEALVSQIHFGAGMNLRNDFSLWEDTPLKRWFQDNLGLGHADDLSSIIFKCLFRNIRGEPRELESMAIHYKEYWKEVGQDPLFRNT